ncbi:MAG: hypothetical protein QOH72_2284, partial [Solirubrobacteraceae bacterium]|nr:hypothetical protein [Solirubrobacteraceae bacterium]
ALGHGTAARGIGSNGPRSGSPKGGTALSRAGEFVGTGGDGRDFPYRVLRRRRPEELYELLDQDSFLTGAATEHTSPAAGERAGVSGAARAPRRAGLRLTALGGLVVVLVVVLSVIRPHRDAAPSRHRSAVTASRAGVERRPSDRGARVLRARRAAAPHRRRPHRSTAHRGRPTRARRGPRRPAARRGPTPSRSAPVARRMERLAAAPRPPQPPPRPVVTPRRPPARLSAPANSGASSEFGVEG